MAMMNKMSKLHQAFEIGVFLKMFDGAWQSIGGIFLLFIPTADLHGILASLTEHDLTHTSHSLLTNYLTRLDSSLNHGAQLFVAAYLLAHGLTKVVLAINLWLGKLWSYPLMEVVLGIYILYQTYQLGFSWSWSLFALTLFDIFFLGLTEVEYRNRRQLKLKSRLG